MNTKQWLASACVLACLTAAGTCFAYAISPRWDEGWLELLRRERGADIVSESVLDRPLAGRIWEWFVEQPDTFYLKAAVLHWGVGFGMACFTLYFANQLFPNEPTIALGTSMLAATTFLCRAQILIVLQPVVPAFGTVICCLTICLLAGTIPNRLPVWNVTIRWVAGFACLAVAGLLSDYFVATVLAGIVWLMFVALQYDSHAARRGYRCALSLAAMMVSVYLVYNQLGSAEARVEVRPEHFLLNGLAWRIKVTLPVWFSSTYVACAGATLERLGSLRLLSNSDALSVGAGLVLMSLLLLPWMRRRTNCDELEIPTVRPWLVIGCIAAVAAGILPIIVMGRRPDLSTLNSRFWTPIVPFALCASVGLLALVVKRRLAWYLAPLCALLAGWALVSDGLTEIHERARVASWGPELRAHLRDDGTTVAIFENGWPGGDFPLDYEIVARIADDWTVEEERRFWAFPNLSAAIEEDTSVGVGLHTKTSGIDIDRKLHAPKINRRIRNLERIGPISRVVWVYVMPSGELQLRVADVD